MCSHYSEFITNKEEIIIGNKKCNTGDKRNLVRQSETSPAKQKRFDQSSNLIFLKVLSIDSFAVSGTTHPSVWVHN